jgi:hypothetical protein
VTREIIIIIIIMSRRRRNRRWLKHRQPVHWMILLTHPFPIICDLNPDTTIKIYTSSCPSPVPSC